MASIEKSMSDLDLKEIQIPSSDVSTKHTRTHFRINNGTEDQRREELEEGEEGSI